MACMMAFICCQMFKNLETKEERDMKGEEDVSDLEKWKYASRRHTKEKKKKEDTTKAQSVVLATS